jgi:hypothetical protein
MAKRIHLDSVPQLAGNVVFTLVVDSIDFYVEQYCDSAFSFLKGRMKVIRPASLKNYHIRGTPLSKLVDMKLSVMNLRARLKGSVPALKQNDRAIS